MPLPLTSLVREIVFLEPTLVSLLGAIALHAAIWLVIHNYEWGGMKYIKNAVQTYLPYKTIQSNYEGDPAVELLGMEKEPGLVYVWNLGILLHHTIGGAFCFAGWYYGLPWLFRHGILTEVAGLDMLDLFYRIPQCFLAPPGPFPTAAMIKDGGTFSPYMCLQVFHHSVGMSVGLVSVLYFAHLPEHQWFGFVLLGGPFAAIAPGLLANLVPPEYYKVHALDKFIQWAVFGVHQRAYYFFPATIALVKSVIAQPVPLVAKVATCYAAVVMTLFNLIVLSAVTDSLRLALMSLKGSGSVPTDVDNSNCHPPPRLIRRRSSGLAVGGVGMIYLQLGNMDFGGAARTAALLLAQQGAAKIKGKAVGKAKEA
uniref:TLC domain-containing protein n=1 Tax=Coccolithus braarudii TaxID=221442 RepID=A0A7S0L3P9_9EUKA|mmetsp:Transcript_1867/g.4008  ORF Transcript_1867/g.4008 Transcript_1867/m.4008 type:complete len:368 (+) Transcript_1867:27-1130(+)